MIFKKVLFFFTLLLAISSCANYNVNKKIKKERIYHSSFGFALIYEDRFFDDKTISKKVNNDDIVFVYNGLKTNTDVKIINPVNSKTIITKVHKHAKYPKIFNSIVSKKISDTLELDPNNPYIEITEIKKNKIFIAKKSNTFDEEKTVADKAPVDSIKVDDLQISNETNDIKKVEKNNFILVINDFYYEDSAVSLKNELLSKSKFDNMHVKKISDKQFRLLVGPFENFNALKNSYISLNNLGFKDLNIYID